MHRFWVLGLELRDSPSYAGQARTQTCRYERRKNATLVEPAFRTRIYSKLSSGFFATASRFGEFWANRLKRAFS
jgi:hypothetical protein